MKSKSIVVLASIFVALGAFIYFYEVKEVAQRRKARELEKKVFVFERDEVDNLRLIYPRETILCAKGSDGKWKITKPINTPADQKEVRGVLSALEKAKIERVIADTVENIDEFGLADPQLKVNLALKGTQTDTLLLGSKNPTGTLVFAKKASEPKIFALSSRVLSDIKKDVYDLRDKRTLVFKKEQVKKIELHWKGREIVCSKSNQEWKMEVPLQVKADKDTVEKILNKVKNAEAKEFVSEKPENLEKYGLRSPQTKLTLWLKPNMAKKMLEIGDRKDGRYYAKDESRDPVFTVSESLVKNLQRKVFDLRYKKIVEYDPKKVDKIRLVYQDSTIACEKDTTGNWWVVKPFRKRAENWKLRGVVRSPKYMNAKEFVSEKPTGLSKYGLEKPQIKAEFYSKGKILFKLLIGKREDGSVYVKTSQKRTVYLTEDGILEDLSVKLSDIVKESKESTKKES